MSHDRCLHVDGVRGWLSPLVLAVCALIGLSIRSAALAQDDKLSYTNETQSAISEAGELVRQVNVELNDANWVIRERGAKKARQIGLLARPLADRLIALAADKEVAVQDAATTALANLGVVALPVLERRLKDRRKIKEKGGWWTKGYSELGSEAQPLVTHLRKALREDFKRLVTLPDKRRSLESQRELAWVVQDINEICEALSSMDAEAVSPAVPELLDVNRAVDARGERLRVSSWLVLKQVGGAAVIAELQRIANGADQDRQWAARLEVELKERMQGLEDVKRLRIDKILNAPLNAYDAHPKLLVPLLKHPDRRVVQFALASLGRSRTPFRAYASEVGTLLSHVDPQIRQMALLEMNGAATQALDVLPQIEAAWRSATAEASAPSRSDIEQTIRVMYGRH